MATVGTRTPWLAFATLASALVTWSADAQVAATQPAPTGLEPAATPAPPVAAPSDPAAAEAQPGPAALPLVSGAGPIECVPSCRSGFLCVRGQCVSPCNPACNSDEICTAAHECVRAEEAPVKRPPGYRSHDGLYFRMALGGGAAGLTMVSNDVDLKGSGGGLAGELALGGTPLAGVALGAGYYFAVAPTSQATGRESGVGFSGRYDKAPAGAISLHLFGPFVDVYPMPTKGLHFLGAAGIGPMTWSQGKRELGVTTLAAPEYDYSGSGGGFLLGAGYEGWVGGQWSLGGLLRFQYEAGSVNGRSADMSSSDTSEGPDVEVEGFGVGILFSATLH